MALPLNAWLDEHLDRISFVRRWPYYATILAKLDAIDAPAVHVMGVSAHGRRFYLHVNVDGFWRRGENMKYLAGVLLHEVHHIVLGHCSDPRFQGPAHADLMELAMEMSANEYISEPLPGKPVVCSDYAHLGIQAGQSTRERYEILVRSRLAGLDVPAKPLLDEHLLTGVGLVRSDLGTSDPSLHDRLARLVADAVSLTKTLDASARLAGRDPARLLVELLETGLPPKRYLDWRSALRVFVSELRLPRHTYSRPNRRLPALVGVVPGRIFRRGDAPVQSLVVAIDTSASMEVVDLNEIGRHLRLLSQRLKITVVECDAAIRRTYCFEGKLHSVAGRGGTDLRPVFDPEFLRPLRPQGVIYFTDGCGPYPEADPGVRTLWVLTAPDAFSCPWGHKAWLPCARQRPARLPF